MPIADAKKWKTFETKNQDAYGKCCVDVAREIMRKLDEDPSPITDTHKLVCDADKAISGGGITGFMAGCVASMIWQVHSRGQEFKDAWNKGHGVASSVQGVVNPAILTVK